MIKKILTAIVAGAFAFGLAAVSQFAAAPVSAEAYTYEPLTGLTEYYDSRIFYYMNNHEMSDPYDGSIPSITGIGYTVTMESNPNNGASGMPVISDASFPGPAVIVDYFDHEEYENEPSTTWSTINGSGITFTKPGTYVWELTPKQVTYPAGVDSPYNDTSLYLHAVVIDNEGALENYTTFFSVSSESSDDASKVSEIPFAYETHSIHVGKEVTGNAGDKSKAFPFTVNLTGCNPGTEIDGTTVANDGTWSKTYQLTHGEEFIIEGIPAGAGYMIEETDADDYTTSFEAEDIRRNLLPSIHVTNGTTNGVTFEGLSDGRVSISGTATAAAKSAVSIGSSGGEEMIVDGGLALPPGEYTICAYNTRLSVTISGKAADQTIIIESGDSYTVHIGSFDRITDVCALVLPSDGEVNTIGAAAIVEGNTPLAEWKPYPSGGGSGPVPGLTPIDIIDPHGPEH